MADNIEVKQKAGKKNAKALPVCENLSFASKEAFKRLRTNMMASFEDDSQPRIIGVTSAQPSDGKTTISINQAYALAELGKKVLLLDADMRRGSVHEKLNLQQAPGLCELMRDAKSIGNSIQHYTGAGITFDIIPSGTVPSNPSELLNSVRMEQLLQALSKAYDYIVIDLPPVGAVVDAVAVSKHIDGMLLVVRENACPRGLLADCISQLRFSNVRILGFVVNGAREGSGKKYQYNRYGGYGGYGYYNRY